MFKLLHGKLFSLKAFGWNSSPVHLECIIIIIQVHKIFGVDFKMGELISGKGVGGPYTLYKKVGTN